MDQTSISEFRDNSRRDFFRRTAALAPATLAVGAVAAMATTAEAQGRGGGVPQLYPSWNLRNFAEIRDDENYHVQALLTLLGPAARPRPNFQNLIVRNPRQFVILSQAFENTGVGAYLGALPDPQQP